MAKKDSDYFYLLKCLELAIESTEKGNHPFGALIVYHDEIICTSENDVVTSEDITGHAEINLVRKVQKILSSDQLKEATLYTSTEPCAMCSGAIYWAGIKNIVFGCSTNQLNKIVGGSLGLTTKEVFETGIGEFDIRDYSKDLIFTSVHKDFWK